MFQNEFLTHDRSEKHVSQTHVWWFYLCVKHSRQIWNKCFSETRVSDTCFRSVALFCDPHYTFGELLPTACTVHELLGFDIFRKTILSWRNLWIFHSCKRVRPVVNGTLQTKKGIRGRKPASKKHLGLDNTFLYRALIQGSLLDWKIDVEIRVEICVHHKCGKKELFLVKWALYTQMCVRQTSPIFCKMSLIFLCVATGPCFRSKEALYSCLSIVTSPIALSFPFLRSFSLFVSLTHTL